MSDLFKEKAEEWDTNRTIQLLSSAVGSCMINNLELHSEMNVMDFGAGTGLITSQIAPHVKKVTAIDVSQSMLDQLIKKLNNSNINNIEIICQDIIKKTLSEKYDLIVSAMAMHHVEDINNILKQFSATLNIGAQIALADLDKEDGSFHPADIQGVYHHGFDHKNLKDKLKKNGFINIKIINAHEISKNGKTYPVFLCTATKK